MIVMSTLAQDLIELATLPAPHGALTERLLREIAVNLIAPGVMGRRDGG
jgi:hypothetical protein